MFPIFGLTNKKGNPMLIGISGKAGSGKDTLGQFLCEEYRCLHYYFAKPLKEGARVMFNLTEEQIENKEERTPTTTQQHRIITPHTTTHRTNNY